MKTSSLITLLFICSPAWAMTEEECQTLHSNAERQAVANSMATLGQLSATLEAMPSPAPPGHPAVPVVDAANKLEKGSSNLWSTYIAALSDYCEDIRR